MIKVKIKNTKNADSRTATNKSKKSLIEASLTHISEVQQVFNSLAYLMVKQGQQHDHTKLTEFDKFYEDYTNKSGVDFISGEWYNIHITQERHHIMKNTYDDVNLIDVIEEIIDKVVAGKGRAGDINLEYFDINDETLRLAYNNTIKLIDGITVKQRGV